jgi:hypothetical protein
MGLLPFSRLKISSLDETQNLYFHLRATISAKSTTRWL